jgi:hypothetical protein
MRMFPTVIAAVLGFANLAQAGSLPVPDLTGTWTGKFSCKGIGLSPLLFGNFKFLDKEATLEIAQADDALTALLEAEDPDFAFPLTTSMCGAVVVDPAKPEKARAGLVAGPVASTGSAFAVDFARVKVFPDNGNGVTGKLTGSGVLIGSSIGGAVSASCKYSLERTSDAPPPPPPSCEEPV